MLCDKISSQMSCAPKSVHKQIWLHKILRPLVLSTQNRQTFSCSLTFTEKFSVTYTKALLSAVVLLQSVGVYTIVTKECGVVQEKTGHQQQHHLHPHIAGHIPYVLHRLVTTKLLHVYYTLE